MMSQMSAVRVFLMVLMCFVTDVPSPIPMGVFESVEEAEELHGARRRKSASVRSLTQPTPGPFKTAVVTQPVPTVRPRSAVRPVAHESARKIPAAAREPAAASDDH